MKRIYLFLAVFVLILNAATYAQVDTPEVQKKEVKVETLESGTSKFDNVLVIENSIKDSQKRLDGLYDRGKKVELEFGKLRTVVSRKVDTKDWWSKTCAILAGITGSASSLVSGYSKDESVKNGIGIAGALFTLTLTTIATILNNNDTERSFLDELNKKVNSWVNARNSLPTMPVKTPSMSEDEIKKFNAQKVEYERSIQKADDELENAETFLRLYKGKFE